MSAMKKQQSTLGKAFEINESASIYGTFAEIGAGQETVNHFFRAGLASQTVAKSMSAYDMSFSDAIYGKQTRYVCKDRVIDMLDHEYKLLQKRLKGKSLKKCFFAFANTAATSSFKKNEKFKLHYSWMGIRFQDKPNAPYNEIVFHANCLDQHRLQQHEALGILGVNLIYSCFYYKNNCKKFIATLMDNLHSSRIQINSISCKGPSLKHFNETLLNIELLNQKLSPFTFFNLKGSAEFISDAIFKKDLLLIHKEAGGSKRNFSKEASVIQKTKLPILLIPYEEINKKNMDKQIKSLASNKFYVLVFYEKNLSQIMQLIRTYTNHDITIVVSQEFFSKKMFSSLYYKTDSLLKSIGLIFDSRTKVKVSNQNKSFSVKTINSKNKESKIINYLISNKKISNL